jgi:hypothetical protein
MAKIILAKGKGQRERKNQSPSKNQMNQSSGHYWKSLPQFIK